MAVITLHKNDFRRSGKNGDEWENLLRTLTGGGEKIYLPNFPYIAPSQAEQHHTLADCVDEINSIEIDANLVGIYSVAEGKMDKGAADNYAPF